MLRRYPAAAAAAALLASLSLTLPSFAQERISLPIDESRTVTLTGNRHPLAREAFDAGPVAPEFRLERMILVLNRDAGRSAALESLLAAQQDPSSPQFQRWLDPSDFENQFGVSSGDLETVTQWLTSHGFSIDGIPAGRQSIIFSGTAAEVEAAFHTAIHAYRVAGELHHANASDPQIPEALSGVVAGAVSIHDFRRKPMHRTIAPQYSYGSTHYLAPADFATIYDVAPLYTSGITGSGQSLAIVGRINIRVSDIQAFRSFFGLPSNNPTVIVNGSDPGIWSTDEEAEADLDVEWSGAVAPQAAVKFVVSASTQSTDGVDLSAQYIVSNNLAPVLSVSFGSCEAAMGTAERAFYNNLWQQAASQGITAMVAAGDSGAAGCDSPSESSAQDGLAVNGLCSTPYSVCVGGTEFNENGNYNLYWSSTNNAVYASALGYIPEVAWNESGSNGGSDLWATGGGASAYYLKPSWQSGPGVPADLKRDVPDVSLTGAASHDGYLVNVLGSYYIIGGTSCASPSFAGIMALVNQKTAARQGNANSALYPLAALQASGGAQVFHSITGGNNSVPGLTGFTASPHYNQATGLGSPDAFVLVNHWTSSNTPVPSFALGAIAPASVTQNSSVTAITTVTVSGGFNAAVVLSATGAPSGVTVSFKPATLAAPGSGSSTITIAAGPRAAAGSYTLVIQAASGTSSKTASLSLTITAPFSVSTSLAGISVTRSATSSITVTTHISTGYAHSLSLSVLNLPAGITASFNPSMVASPGSGTSQLSLTTSSSAIAGSYTITVQASDGTIAETAGVSVTVPPLAGYTIAVTPASLTIAQGSGASTNIVLTRLSGFAGIVSVTNSALPSGVTAKWSTTTTGATLTFSVGATTTVGSYPITITAASPGTTGATGSVTLNITHASAHSSD